MPVIIAGGGQFEQIGRDPETGETVTREARDDGPLAGLVFKIMTDPFVGQLAFYALACVGFLVRGWPGAPALVRTPFYFCLVNAAALKGLADFLVGLDRSVWEKSESTRR